VKGDSVRANELNLNQAGEKPVFLFQEDGVALLSRRAIVTE
jgi:hypothetical protein